MGQVDSSVPGEEQRIQDIFGTISITRDLNSGTYRVNPHLCVIRSELCNIVYFSLVEPSTLKHGYYAVVLLTKVLRETH